MSRTDLPKWLTKTPVAHRGFDIAFEADAVFLIH